MLESDHRTGSETENAMPQYIQDHKPDLSLFCIQTLLDYCHRNSLSTKVLGNSMYFSKCKRIHITDFIHGWDIQILTDIYNLQRNS